MCLALQFQTQRSVRPVMTTPHQRHSIRSQHRKVWSHSPKLLATLRLSLGRLQQPLQPPLPELLPLGQQHPVVPPRAQAARVAQVQATSVLSHRLKPVTRTMKTVAAVEVIDGEFGVVAS
jgi:hypothetical protein